MSKAILVIDMPNSCNECDIMCPQYYAAIEYKEINEGMKPSDCPLREVPEKKIHTLYSIGAWNSGYNACIDEILGGSEDNE